jgi:putative hydrolase of the HAD superfamily
VSEHRRRAVVFDAYGTLIALDDPVGRLQAALAVMGHAYAEPEVADAFAAEVRFYRAHHDRGRDDRSLDVLRRACAAVFASALPARLPVEVAESALREGLRYRPFDDVAPVLDALVEAGYVFGVVSNWDASLPAALAEAGLADRFAAVSVSALAGARKPESAIFLHALDALGVAPRDAVHVGDDPVRDCVGAANAGLRAVLIDRGDRFPGVPCVRIETLAALPGVL